MSNNPKARILAFYLPQFHPIPENDEWWGKGFTEWTNVGKAKSLFPGHYQPKVPSDLGYYDLRVPETRESQAELAKQYGIEGFVYWHYWFGNGKRLLERPFNEVIASCKPDFPFALAWANESWRGFFHGLNNEREILIEQKYPGKQDYINHFYQVLTAFKDKRYITVEDKPLFMIYHPFDFPEVGVFIQIWQELARQNGLDGIYFTAISYDSQKNEKLLNMGFDAVNTNHFNDYKWCRRSFMHSLRAKYYNLFYHCPNVVFYDDLSRHFISSEETKENVFPTLFPNWDHSPRTGNKGIIVMGSTPEAFAMSLRAAKESISNKPHDKSLVFIKSWNEWAEGNYLEPDLRFGHSFLQAIMDVFK